VVGEKKRLRGLHTGDGWKGKRARSINPPNRSKSGARGEGVKRDKVKAIGKKWETEGPASEDRVLRILKGEKKNQQKKKKKKGEIKRGKENRKSELARQKESIRREVREGSSASKGEVIKRGKKRPRKNGNKKGEQKTHRKKKKSCSPRLPSPTKAEEALSKRRIPKGKKKGR